MNIYITIRFKKKTAERFQQFSKTHYKTHTEAMAGMLDFFLYNKISPKENFGPTGSISPSHPKNWEQIIPQAQPVLSITWKRKTSFPA